MMASWLSACLCLKLAAKQVCVGAYAPTHTCFAKISYSCLSRYSPCQYIDLIYRLCALKTTRFSGWMKGRM